MGSAVDIIDKAQALEQVDGDEELFQELVELYLDEVPKQVEILENALTENDITLAERQAHSLKSASANIGAHLLREYAFTMEVAARESDIDTVRRIFEKFQTEFNCLQDFAQKEGFFESLGR